MAGWFLSLLVGFSCLPGGRAMVLTDDSYLYRIWSVESGLPQVSVTAMVQDAEGYMWLGTQNGLARFDGVQFKVFNTANTPNMPSNLITSLLLDQQQRLWIGTVNGLVRYQQQQFVRLDRAQPLQGAVMGLAELTDGTVYIGADRLYRWLEQESGLESVAAHNGAVYSLRAQHNTLWLGGENGFARIDAAGYRWFKAPPELNRLQISAIAQLNNELYLASNLGLYQWQQGLWHAVTLPDEAGQSHIESLYLDPEQRLWGANYKHLYEIGQGQARLADIQQQDGSAFVWIKAMLQDKHGNFWLGSNSHGLMRLRRPPTRRFSTAQGLADPYSWAVQPWQQHMLVGTSSGLALLQHGRFQSLTANSQLPGPFVYSMLLDSAQRLWVGTRSGLALLDGKSLAWQRNFTDIAHLLVTTMVEEEKQIWVGTSGGLYHLDNERLSQQGVPVSLQQAKIRTLLLDNQKQLWVGTENGLYLRDSSGFNQVKHMPLSAAFISTIKQFADGSLLIGSFDQGFVLGKPGQWQWFTEQNGLPGNGVMHVEQVDNQLVVSNFQGIYRVNYPALQQGRVEQLYMLIDDRRPDAQTDSHRCCNGAGSSKGVVHQGRIWYPTLDGIITLPLQQLIQHAPVPAAVLESLSSADKQYQGNSAKLAPAQRDWHFRFTAPYYVQASSMQFRYQLVGYEPNWVDADNRREAFYTNLPPGHYRFNVQVKVAADYRWSDIVSMDIELAPYWHETTWARSTMLIVLLLLLWAVYRWRLKVVEQSQQHLALQIAERTRELFQANQKLKQMSMQDALTGLHNRHYLDMNIHQILSRANRQSGPLYWALLDLDHFKQINDTYGHQAGDAILCTVAGLLRENSRSSDHIIRWGGEEFLILLEHSEDALLVLQRINSVVSQYPWQEKMGLQQPVTCSVGAIAQLPQWHWQHCLRLADQALYWVKEHGRNGYMLLQSASVNSSGVLPADASLGGLISQGQLNAVSNKDFTFSPVGPAAGTVADSEAPG